jgi:cation diffusion facilitator CzcD-associated flavoprotein CzcO
VSVPPERQFDVIVVGAGLSGVGAAWHLQKRCPRQRYAILEARDAIGGTWDLFRYPGVRSDSDMHTLGYCFRPWRATKAIADGPAIRAYVRETAAEHGIDRQIRFGHRVVRVDWSSEEARWTVEVEHEGAPLRFSARFLLMCAGYYRYSAGYLPEWPGMQRFAGLLVHPQAWPEDLEAAGKRFVVIGSGATAVTLVPALAAEAAQVSMLQRSPTYMISAPAIDRLANLLRRVLPARLAYALTRAKNVLLQQFFFQLARRRPERVKRRLIGWVQRALPAGYDVATHFTPRYGPWDQRLCLVPDDDFFAAIRAGRAEVVTDEIATFTESGLRLRSGRELAADVIVTATGLQLEFAGGARITVDGRPVDVGKTLAYKGAMLSNVPNFASVFGYTNASWTLKADLISAWVCRLLRHMERHGYAQCTPRDRGRVTKTQDWVDFSSGYIQRSLHLLPRQGERAPWKLYQSYFRDMAFLRFGPLEDGAMEFRRAGATDPALPDRRERAQAPAPSDGARGSLSGPRPAAPA